MEKLIRMSETLTCQSQEISTCSGTLRYISYGGKLIVICDGHYEHYRQHGLPQEVKKQ